MSCKLSKRPQAVPDQPDEGLDLPKLAELYPASYHVDYVRKLAAEYNRGYDAGVAAERRRWES